MDKNGFKYKLQKNGSTMLTQRDLTWIERFKYWLKGYEVIKLN